MNILHAPVVHKINTILVPWESYIYLQEECHRQRSESGKPLSDKYIERLRLSFESNSHNGLYEIGDGYLGGCNGDPHNAWEERRWTSWSARTMAEMLDDNGLSYLLGGEKEVISL